MGRTLPGLKVDYDRKDQDLALAILDALEPVINKQVSSGPLLPTCPNNGQQHFLSPDQITYYFDQTRSLWLSMELYKFPFGRRGNNIGNNILLRTTDALLTSVSGVPIPHPNEMVIVGMAADWGNNLVSAGFQVQVDGFATVANLTAANADYATDFNLSDLVPNGDFLSVRTNGLSAGIQRPSVNVYARRYQVPT